MPSIYEYDLKTRFPTHDYIVTVDNDITTVTVEDESADFVTKGIGMGPNAERNAYRAARRNLGVPDIEVPLVTTTQRDLLSADDGFVIQNATTDQREECQDSTWAVIDSGAAPNAAAISVDDSGLRITAANVQAAIAALDGVQRSTVVELGTTGAIDIDFDAGNEFRAPALTGDVTFSFTNLPSSGTAQRIRIVILQGSTDRTVTFPAVDFLEAGAPVMPSGPDKILFAAVYTNGNEVTLTWIAEE